MSVSGVRALLVTLAGVLASTVAGCAGNATTSSMAPADQATQARIRQLELRVQRLVDIGNIKRLQRAYGYYLDEGQWDDVADLFAGSATLEIGKDGVYRGRERIRQYFRTLGKGRNGLVPGQLNEHFQEMPVITLGGTHSAQGTWRDIMLTGLLGREAWWAEGPTEVRYVKEDGVWKIASLQWFQTLHVPYEGGWAKNADANGARYVGDALPPDAPPSREYKTWPGTFTPPFHFRGQYPGLQPLVATGAEPAAAGDWNSRVAQVLAGAQQLADQDNIENLQRIYGFYLDKGLWNEATSLLTEDAELEIQGRGIFRGRARILEYLRGVGPAGPEAGRLYDHMMLQPVTHVDAGTGTARARWHLFAQLARHGQFHEWATGVYENQYRRENGKWMISRVHFYPTMVTPYESGWGKVALPFSRFEPALGPDAPSRGASSGYENSFVTPFHYRHPVRNPGRAASPRPPSATDPAALERLLAEAERQVAAAEDRHSIENIQTAYGYYLATLLWDDLTDLFADHGTIEIAMRGVYAGKASVRRNLNLYGQAGLDDGVLHNHMQFQPVIHVSTDGTRANLRSRALSMMGNFDRNATWMAGTYENEFQKIDGRWKFVKDQQVNTYFSPYETGWKELPQRAPPGITDSNPPDRPPSMNFDLYPKNFLVPFHYANPVTGAR